MRLKTLCLVALSLLLVQAPAEAKRKKRKKRSNLPAGWVWPPSAAMKKVGATCMARLDELGVEYRKGKKRLRQVSTPVVVPSMTFGAIELVPTFRKPPFVMDCHLAVALAENAELFAQLGIAKLHFSSIYSYRTVRVDGKKKSSLSRHALGLAVDIFEITMADGTHLVVEDDYWSLNFVLPAIEVAINGTGGFRTVLSPFRDPRSHYDHFHLEARMAALERKRSRRAKRSKAKRQRAKKRRRAKRRRSKRERK
jgi:hypothetical protein